MASLPDALDRLDARVPARLRRPEAVLLAIALVFAGAAGVRADRLSGGTADAPAPAASQVAKLGEALAWFAAPLVPADAAALAEAAQLDVSGVRVDLLAGQQAQAGQPGHRDLPLPEGASLEARILLALEALAGELRAEASELRGYGATTEMADFSAQYEADALHLEALAAREPASCACVGGLLLSAPPPGAVPGFQGVEIL